MDSYQYSNFVDVSVLLQVPAYVAILKGPEHRFELANDSYLDLIQRDQSILGKKLIDVLPYVQEQGFITLLDEVYKSGKPYHGKEIALYLNRENSELPEKRYVNFVYHPLKDSNGAIHGIFVHGVDVSEQVESRLKISESEQKYRSLFESMDQGFCLIKLIFDENNKSKDYIFQEINPTFERQTGLKNALGKSARELVPNLEQRWIDIYGEVAVTGKPLQFIEGSEAMGKWFEVYAFRYGNPENHEVALLFTDITERKLTNEALEQSENMMRLINNSLPAFIAYLDDQERYIFVNDAYEKWFNLSGEDIKYKRAYEVVGEEAYKRAKPSMDKVLSGSYVKYENTIYSPNGEAKDLEVEYVPNKAEDGSIKGFIVLGHDITERKRSEMALKRSEQYYKTMTDNTPVKTWLSNSKSEFTYLNKQWYEYTGQTQEGSNINQLWLKALHPFDIQKFKENFAEASKNKVPFSFEMRVRDKNHNFRWHINEGLPKFDEKGNFEGFVGAIIDIHERIVTEEKLRISEEFSRTLIESSPDCVQAIDLAGRVLSINPQGLVMLEIDSLGELQDTLWKDYWRGENYKDAVAAFENAKKGGIGHFIAFAKTRKGTDKWWDVLIAPIYNADREIERLITVSRDITKLKELEQQKDDFIGIASHELKTPVTSIKAYTQVLQHKFEDSGDLVSANMLSKMDAQLNRLTYLISDLLDVTKISQGELLFRREDFNFNELIQESVEEIQRMSFRHAIEKNINSDVVIYGDKDRIGQVITNFLTNAIKYSPQSDKIVIESYIENEHVFLCVQDFGIGLTYEDKQKVFNRFYRVGGSGYETYPGLGLGLYISKEIIRRHDGKIWAESEINKGSRFYFSLPINKNKKVNMPVLNADG